MLKCSQNDIAMVMCGRHAGKIVRCCALTKTDAGIDAWRIDPHLQVNENQKAVAIADWMLQPLRKPGDNEVDETLHKGRPGMRHGK